MQSSSPHAAAVPKGRMPAWIISIAFHSFTLLLLGVAIEQAPRGASEAPVRSAGIVLKRTSAAGDLYEGEEELADAQAAAESSQAPEEAASAAADERAATVEREAPPVSLTSTPGNGASDGGADGALAEPKSSPAGSTRARGTPEGDNYAKVSVFGVQGRGTKFVYVFDRSSSMEGPPLATAKRQLIASLKSLETVHQFHIIFFNHRLRSLDVTGGGRRIAFGTERNKKLAANFIGGITADGGTDRFAALKQALAFRPDVIFFLTDADDAMSASELAEMERLNERAGASICVIEFGRTPTKPEKNFLIELARQSGGQYGYVDTTKLKP